MLNVITSPYSGFVTYVHNANFIWHKGREIEQEHKWLWRMPPYLSELWP